MRAAARSLFASILIFATLIGGAASAQTSSRRVTYYYQTQYYQGNYVSLAPIWEQINPHTRQPVTTDVMVAAFHLGYDNGNNPYIHLNDNVPGDPMFDQMWKEVATLQSYGVTVRMMLGGAAQGSYADLFSQWDTFYPILKQTLQQYNLNGIDLDIEEIVSLPNVQMLITQLDADFGPNFIMTMAPVASAFWGGPNLSGFDYRQLYQSQQGQRINWYNGQFYSGFATMSSPADYERAINAGWPADKIVAGVIGNPQDGSGYVPPNSVMNTVHTLIGLYPSFGGMDCWEYFNALPGGLSNPVKWASDMAIAMGTYPLTHN